MSETPASGPNPPNREVPSPWVRENGRVVVATLFAAVFYIVLWITVFDAVTSALAASGVGVLIVAGGAVSDTVAAILEVVGEMIGAVLGAIAVALAAIFSNFS